MIHFCDILVPKKSKNKIEKNQERCLWVFWKIIEKLFRTILNSRFASFETQSLLVIACKVFKTLNDLIPNFLKGKFYHPLNLT